MIRRLMVKNMDKVSESEICSGAQDVTVVNRARGAERAAARRTFGAHGQPVPMIVRGSRLLSNSVLQLSLQREDDERLVFEPGQFCSIAIPAGADVVQRSYSIATRTTDPARNRICEIAVTRVTGGVATEYLFSRQVGDRVRVSGPFGRLILPGLDPPRYVLIGTGTGVAPYRAMLPELVRRASLSPIEVVLAMGVRTRRDLIYADEFRAMTRRCPWFRFTACYSRESSISLLSFERHGRVQAAQAELALTPGRDRVYLCGHPAMIDDWTCELEAAGFAKRDIVREKYISPKPPRRPPSKSPTVPNPGTDGDQHHD